MKIFNQREKKYAAIFDMNVSILGEPEYGVCYGAMAQ
jgi:hypothetical protein